jgi:hypothetical protein
MSEYIKLADKFIKISDGTWVRVSQIESVSPTIYNGMRRAKVRMISGTEHLSSTEINVESIMKAIAREPV